MTQMYQPIIRTTLLVIVSVVLSCGIRCVAQQPDSSELGKRVYQQHCLRCHGENGNGSDEYSESLAGDLPVEDLAQYIAETMPEDDPGLVEGEDAEQVAQYIYDAFYSVDAQKRFSSARVELSRLTVRQYQESVADLLNSFRNARWHFDERGLSADYFASRRWTEKRRLADQVDPTIDFADGVAYFDPTGEYEQLANKEKKEGNKMNVGFSAYWSGSLLAPETGRYEFIVESKNGFQFWLNNPRVPLIDREVRSDDVVEHKASIFLLGGRSYPIKLQMFSYPDPPAKIRLLWKPPHSVPAVVPESALMPHQVPASLAVSTAFPADDASAGYERGISVSKQWDESTTSAAIEVAGWVTDHLWELARVKEKAVDREEKVQGFCRQFVERALARPISDQEYEFFVGQHFDNPLPIKDQVKRVILLTLKSPRFLFPALETRDSNYDVARQVALAAWDSLPDKKLTELAERGKLMDARVLDQQVKRMIEDPRTKSKLESFFAYWLKTEEAAEASKDKKLFPGFDDNMLADLKQSLRLYLDDVVWNERSDFRDLFRADYLYVNQRLCDFYGIEAETEGNTFSRVQVDKDERAGILTHPFLMAGLAYHKETSPIHRGVFIARNLLGRRLKQPPIAVAPLTEEFDPDMTTRQRVEHQTKEAACMNCHSVINPLGFSLENFDAVGRFRTTDKEKPIDVAAVYKTPTGETVALQGARQLAEYLAENEMAQRSFIRQLFHHFIKQPVDAFGEDKFDYLYREFVESNYNIRNLIVEIVKVGSNVDGDPNTQTTSKPEEQLGQK
jgi:cytochrome c553